MTKSLDVKDLINVGIFSAVYMVVMMGIVTFIGMVPLLYLLAPIGVAFITATIYLLFLMKVPKPGAVFILSVLMSFLFMAAAIYASVWVLFIGLVTELMLIRKGHASISKIKRSYMIFSLTTVGPYFGIFIMKNRFLEKTAEYYGQGYSDMLNRLTPPWILIPLMVGTIFAAYLGARAGERLLSKHFKKAGIV